MEIMGSKVDTRKTLLAALLVATSIITFYTVSRVFWTIFFAVTVAYVLYPYRRHLKNAGMSDRQAAATLTALSCASVFVLIAPVLFVLFRRRDIFIDYLNNLPQQISINIGEFSYNFQSLSIEPAAREWATSAAVDLAQSTPSLSIKAFVFVFVLYALLRYYKNIETATMEMAPEGVQSVIYSYHRRVYNTLSGLYAVQTLTGVLTFIIALPMFYLLGYDAFITLAVISGILQLIPVIGPTLLILILVIVEIIAGFPLKALVLLVVGMIMIAFLPDALLRPRLADRTTGLPASLYFIGFVGGILTLGPIGILAGPLAIAVLLETFQQLRETETEEYIG